MASIGQIAAGVAHEINNPIGYVLSNLGTLDSYLLNLFGLLEAYVESERPLPVPLPASLERARALREGMDIDFLRGDVVALLAESRDGILRVKHIVQDLKDFSRGGVDEAWESVNLHEAIERTVNIVRNEIKHKARIETSFGNLPDVECLPSRLHQVFLNLIVNAGHAIEASGTITISTGASASEIWVRFEDTGCGIAKEHLNRIFEPFFTTKPVGQGTGLGLSLSYAIVRQHGGCIEVDSEVGRGSQFTIRLPVRQTRTPAMEAEPAQGSVAAPA
jgi:signal transduction histidine kinase